MVRKVIFFLFIGLTTINFIHAQTGSVGIGTNNPHNSAALEIQNNSKGLLLSRMTTAQRNAIASPAMGLLVFDTDKHCLFLFDGASWQAISILGENNSPPIGRVSADLETGDLFGSSVSISGNYAIIGAPGDSINAIDQGSAYIFVRQGNDWIQQAKLVAGDGAADDAFGHSVAISGDFAVVGAPFDDVLIPPFLNLENRGSIYIFRRTGSVWNQFIKLSGTDGAANDLLGYSVSISGNYIIAGAWGDDIDGKSNQGSAYIYFFDGTTWAQQAKLVPGDGAGNDEFGYSVSISGDNVVIGAPGHTGALTQIGKAYVWFRISTIWFFDEVLEDDPLTASTGDRLGESVSISGLQIILGSESSGKSGKSASGFLMFFERVGTSWTWRGSKWAADAEQGDFLGHSVFINGNIAIAGATGDNSGAYENLGSVYVFKRSGNNWNFFRKIEIPANIDIKSFGNAVAMDGNNILIGTSPDVFSKGKVYFLNLE